MDEFISIGEVILLQPKPREDRYFQTQSLDDAYEYGWRDLQKCVEKLRGIHYDSKRNKSKN